MKLIDKSALVAKIEELDNFWHLSKSASGLAFVEKLLSSLDTLEVKEVDLMIHTIMAECCDWLVMNTNLSYDEIENCRNMMLTVKEEQLKAQKGE